MAGALDASQTWTQAATSWNSGTAPCTLPRHATVLTTPAPWYRVTTRARLGRPAGRITGPSAIYYIGRRDRRYRTHQQYLTWPEVRLTFYRFCGAWSLVFAEAAGAPIPETERAWQTDRTPVGWFATGATSGALGPSSSSR